jgi:hypothetical protein
MKKKILLTLFCLFLSISISSAEETLDLEQLSYECIESSKVFKNIQNDFAYKVLHTVTYEGWSGDSKTFKLKYPVRMTIKYAGAEKQGYYLIKNYHKKIFVNAKSDMKGNFELFENIGGGFKNYIFHGTMKNGIIKGLWQKGNGKKAFAFYVKAIE